MASIGGLAGGDLAPVVGAAFGVVAELDDGHDVQHPVDPPVPGPGQPMALLSPEEASIGAVPFQEAKCAWVGNRAMSPTSPSSRAAPEGPMPLQVQQPAAGRGDQLASAACGWS